MVSANKIEILRIAEAVAQEKMIDKSIVITALEEAIAKAAKSNYGEENEVIVEINQENGDISISRKMLVVEEVKNKFLEITLKAAKKINGAAQIGDHLLDPLPPLDFGRIAAQSAKQVINSKVREAERERQYNEYKDRVGEIVNGIVKRTEFGNSNDFSKLGFSKTCKPRSLFSLLTTGTCEIWFSFIIFKISLLVALFEALL